MQEHAELDIAFEDIVGRPQALVQDLAARLGLAGKVGLAGWSLLGVLLHELEAVAMPYP